MRLVRVEHERCNEWDGTEYFLAPTTFSAVDIDNLVQEVASEMVADARKVREAPENPGSSPKWGSADSTKTVGEVMEEFEKAKSAYAEWLRENKVLQRSFGERMKERGFFYLWEPEADVLTIRNSWGHSHGLALNYKQADSLT